MGELTRFLRTIRTRPDVRNQFFDQAFLKGVGLTLEKRGFAEAKLFVWDNHFRSDLEKQAVILLGILGEMEKIEAFKKNRAMGGHLIKSMGKVA